jgi:ribonuclease I
MARFLVAALLVSCIATVACRQQPVYPKLNVPVHTNKDNRGISPCAIGPSFWCRDQRNQDACGVTDLNVGVAGFSTLLVNETTVGNFCKTNPTALKYVGGLIGTPQKQFSVFVLALYWAPTGCPAVGLGNGGFCSAYTQKGFHAANNLVLHGLWPDFGQIYESAGNPAPYVGFPQWCNGDAGDFFECSIQGKLCSPSTPGFNVSSPTFSQSQYEFCLRAQNGPAKCLVPDPIIRRFTEEWKVYAPGYVGANSTGGYGFLDHEFNKHGTCVGGKLTRSKAAYFSTGLEYVKKFTQPGTAAQRAFSDNAGKNVTLEFLNAAYSAPLINQGTTDLSQDGRLVEDYYFEDDKESHGRHHGDDDDDSYRGHKHKNYEPEYQKPKLAKYAAFQCNAQCQINEVWYCIGRDSEGYPTGLYACGPGELASDTCTSRNCTTVQIPAYA